MKVILVILHTLLSLTLALPIDNDRIVYPDYKIIEEIVDRFGDYERDPKSLFDDPNLLKSENATAAYLIDDEADTKYEYGTFYQDTFDELKILFAMLDIEKYTCIQFVPRSSERNYVHIHSGVGCNSHLGRQGGRQLISLQRKGCMSRGTIIHELIHALGYDHMQNHNDRDKYVYILWDNIVETQKNNFQKVSPYLFSNFGTQYDFYSVMHYEPYAFSKNGKPTVVPKDSKFNKIIGQRNALSSGDAERINNMYKCYS
ncbi:hypothetical protein ACKWTF_016212 [Chironomus riparius]